MSAIGSHCILELHGCPGGLLDDKEQVLEAIRRASEAANATLLGEVAHHFEPHGVTALALLAESHISIHTWPELGYAACDVFTCGDNALPERACETLVRMLQAERFEQRRLPRGGSVPARSDRFPASAASADRDSTSEVA